MKRINLLAFNLMMMFEAGLGGLYLGTIMAKNLSRNFDYYHHYNQEYHSSFENTMYDVHLRLNKLFNLDK